ncbi:MAG: 16S rRNA (cytosine(1402)-N(4))-methyltransferase RsmH [bacterium]
MSLNTQRSTEYFHIPVLVDEVVKYLITDLKGIYVDCTVGGGGHAEAVINKLGKKARYYGIDRDRDAIRFARQRLEKYGKQVILMQGELANIDTILKKAGVKKVDGIFMDLGVSSYQIDTPERGFSYRHNGPLDMRMDGSQKLTAESIINNYPEDRLADIFYYYGEERFSRKIARVIVERRKKRICTTEDLANILREIVPRKYQVKVLSRIWQSLRVEVNNELEQLKVGLTKTYDLLREGARMVVISWESLSDRMIKRYFKGQTLKFTKYSEVEYDTGFNFDILTKKVIRPSRDEINKNPRAKSAKMRAAIKIKEYGGN